MKKLFCLIALFTLFIPRVQASNLNNINMPNVYDNQFKIKHAEELTQNQWYLNDIGISKAWEISTGRKEFIIAVLDSGVNSEHPALSGRILPGYDFVNEDPIPNDDLGHGTFVAGIIAANADGKGITGIDFHSKILPIKVADSKGEVKDQDLIEGIQFAVAHEADIINMSFGTTKRSEEVAKAIMEAKEAGIVIVAASGNFFSNSVDYPAAYPGVIAVGAYNEERKPSLFSNKGIALDLLAPGINILSTSHNGDYEFRNGTSYAAPIVSAVAALLKAKHPNWTSEQIEWAIEQGGSFPSQKEVWNDTYGYGLLNAFNSLSIMRAPKDNINKESLEINIGSGKRAFLELPNDVDSYYIKPYNKDKITIKVDAEFPYLTAEIYDTNNKLVKTMDDNSSKQNTNLTFTFLPQEEQYFILVKHKYKRWENKPYTVSVSNNKKGIPPTKEKLVHDLQELNIIEKNYKQDTLVTRLDALNVVMSRLEFDSGVNTNWIQRAYELGLISGISEQSYNPHEQITRAELAVILYRTFSLPTSEFHTTFKDVPRNHWAFNAVQAFALNQLATGYKDQTFRPDEKVTLEHTILLLDRVLQYNYFETIQIDYE